MGMMGRHDRWVELAFGGYGTTYGLIVAGLPGATAMS